jgi:hypothetical protein
MGWTAWGRAGSYRGGAEEKVKTTTVYVSLPREAVPVWAPVDAEHLRDDLYRIVDCRGEDEEAEFGKGTVVRCEVRHSEHGNGEDILVAVQAVDSN